MPAFGVSALPDIPGTSLVFTDKDVVFSSNNKELIVKVGGGDETLIFPLQPIIEARVSRNWVLTEVAGSGTDPTLSGSTIKENMGVSDARLTISGILISSEPTLVQMLKLQTEGVSKEQRDWVAQLKEIKKMFDFEGPLAIMASTPEGENLFEYLGITHVVPLTFTFNEKAGYGMKAYSFYLLQDRVVSIDKVLPIEEGE